MTDSTLGGAGGGTGNGAGGGTSGGSGGGASASVRGDGSTAPCRLGNRGGGAARANSNRLN
eukprot:1865138-Prymnesium_polylepis.1